MHRLFSVLMLLYHIPADTVKDWRAMQVSQVYVNFSLDIFF